MPLITRRRFGAALLACAVLAPPAHAAPTWLSGSALSIPVRDGAWTTPAALGADGEALLLSARGGFGVKPVLGFVRTAPAALSGVSPATVMDGSENRDSLTLAGTASGAAVGAWITGSATSARVMTADRGAGATAFDTPVAITTPGPRVSQLRLAGNAKGDFALAYTKDDTVVVRVRPAGAAAFGDEQLVSTAAARSSALAVTPSGEVLVTWLQGNRLHAALRSGATFGAAQRVGAESVPTSDSPASVAAGPDGRVVIAYAEGDKIVVADRAPGASTVGAPVTLPDSGRNTYETVPAQVAFDASGAVSVVWTTGASTVAGRVYVATRTAAAPAFGAPVALSPETGAIVRSATIATHPAGTASAVVWRQQVGSTRSIQGAWRRTATFTFSAAQTLGSASDVENPRLAVSPEGDALATWASDAGYDPDWEENQWSARAAVLDAAGPKLELTAPETVTAGAAVALSATAQDAWSALDGELRWTFGDGHSATGATAEHRYTDPGTYEVTATAADAVGNSTTVRRTVRVTAVAAAPGPQWLDPVTLSEPSDTAPDVRVGLSGGGDAVAVWPQGERSASDDAAPATVRGAVRPLGTAWVPQASGLSTPGLTGAGAAVTIADSGEALAAWAESPSREVRSATRRAGDRSFGQILQRGQAGSTGAPTPALAGGVRGDAVLVWTVDAGERLQGRVRPAGAADFGAVQTLSPEVGSSRVDLQACKLEYSIVSPK